MNKKGPNNPSDSLSVQFKNTKAQVVGTWQKVASSFLQVQTDCRCLQVVASASEGKYSKLLGLRVSDL